MTNKEEDEYPKHLNNIPYSDDSALNTLDICLPRPLPTSETDEKQNIWLIYIHGGAWRDPCICSASFSKIQEDLLTSKINSRITAYASLNYRLSPYPSHPTDPSSPDDPSRNATHPDHITDILHALLYLQTTYPGSASNYILTGHSVGATLAFQVAMKRYWGSQYESTLALELNVVPPLAIVGIEGIYDIPALIKTHEGEPAYRDFVVNAFGSGSGKAEWAAASPTLWGEYEESWADGRVVVLAHSRNDGLVEFEQAEVMREMLEFQGFNGVEGEGRVKMVELRGGHDEVWQTGEASRAVEVAVEELGLASTVAVARVPEPVLKCGNSDPDQRR